MIIFTKAKIQILMIQAKNSLEYYKLETMSFTTISIAAKWTIVCVKN